MPKGRQKGLYVLRRDMEGEQRLGETGRGAGGGSMGVIVSSSLVSAANCLDECRAMAASQ